MQSRRLPWSIALLLFSVSCKGPQGPAGSGVESLTDPTVMPRVLDTYPPANSRGPYDDPYYPCYVYVRFNKIMDRVSIRRSTTVASPTTKAQVDTSYVFSPGGDFFQFYVWDSVSVEGYRLNHFWKVGEIYTLRVARTAKDINGIFLQQQYAMTFMPEPEFRVRSTTPSNGATGIAPGETPYIYVDFNSGVDTSIFSSLEVTPAVPGRWRVSFNNRESPPTTVIYSHNGLATNTQYTLSVRAGARDKLGNQLPRTFSASFHTSAFRVRRTRPTDGQTDVDPNESIYVYLTGPIDTSTVRGSFTIVPSRNGNFSLYPGTSFGFIHSNQLLPSTMYTVSVGQSLRSAAGEPLSSAYTFSFLTNQFGVSSTYPYDGSTGVSRYLSSIGVNFNYAIDTASVRSAFSLPGMTGVFSLSNEGSSVYYNLSNTPLRANTAYTITISTAMRSQSGAQLQSPYSFSFTTGS